MASSGAEQHAELHALVHNVAHGDVVLSVRGGQLAKPAHDAFWGGYSGYFCDPDGHPWEVAYNPFMVPGPDGTVILGG